MKPKLPWPHVLLVTLVVLVGVVGYDAYKASHGYDSRLLRLWLRNNRYTRIHVGMTKQQVRAVLGPPEKVSSNPVAKTWAYADVSGKAKAIGGVPDDVTWVRFAPNHRVKDVMPSKSAERVKAAKGIIPEMTEHQVEELAGKPVHVRESRLVESWIYPHWNRTEHSITFDKAGKVGVVSVSYRQRQLGDNIDIVCEIHR